MAFLTGKFIKWDRLLMEMKKSPALFWARGEARAGDRLQGRKFPTDFSVGLPKAGDGTRGASGLLKIL